MIGNHLVGQITRVAQLAAVVFWPVLGVHMHSSSNRRLQPVHSPIRSLDLPDDQGRAMTITGLEMTGPPEVARQTEAAPRRTRLAYPSLTAASTLCSANKAPHFLREEVARVLSPGQAVAVADQPVALRTDRPLIRRAPQCYAWLFVNTAAESPARAAGYLGSLQHRTIRYPGQMQRIVLCSKRTRRPAGPHPRRASAVPRPC